MNIIPKQAVIMAGGFGSRLSPEINPLKCKSLIKIGKQTNLGYLIDSLKKSGIAEFIFKTSKHSHDAVKDIILSKNLSSYELIEGNSGFRETPYFIKELLHDRFLFICGHQMVTPEHIKNMLEKSTSVKNVISLYNNAQYPLNKERRILYSNDMFQRVSINEPNLSYNHWYARNPYIVEKDIAEIIHKNNYEKTFSYYLFRLWEKHRSLDGVYANMPPEFDYDHEFTIVKDFFTKNRLIYES